MKWKNRAYDYSNARKISDVIPDAFIKKLSLVKSEIPGYQKCSNKKTYVRGVFFDFLKLMMDDLIENNHKFVSPNREFFTVYIREKATRERKRLLTTKAKIYKDVDLISSDAKFYEFVLSSPKLTGKKYRKIRIGHHKYKQLMKKVNEGRRYFVR